MHASHTLTSIAVNQPINSTIMTCVRLCDPRTANRQPPHELVFSPAARQGTHPPPCSLPMRGLSTTPTHNRHLKSQHTCTSTRRLVLTPLTCQSTHRKTHRHPSTFLCLSVSTHTTNRRESKKGFSKGFIYTNFGDDLHNHKQLAQLV